MEIDPEFFRPAEVNYLCGDSSKAREKLGWTPKYSFADLVNDMLKNDVELARAELEASNKGKQ